MVIFGLADSSSNDAYNRDVEVEVLDEPAHDDVLQGKQHQLLAINSDGVHCFFV